MYAGVPCYCWVQFGNPHSRTHMYGWESEEAVEVARGQVGVWGGEGVSIGRRG